MVSITKEGYYVNKKNQEKFTLLSELKNKGYNPNFFTRSTTKGSDVVNPFDSTPVVQKPVKKDPFNSTVDSMSYNPNFFAMKKNSK